jgi:large subunit ribosomal protein L25
MKTVSLSGSPRENVGKKDAKHLREQGMVPCVVYGGKEQVHFSMSELALNKIINTADVYLVDLEAGSFKGQAIVQDIQFHPVTDRIVHVDFIEATAGKELKVILPVILVGNSVGVRNGGRLSTPNKKLAVRGVPAELPEAFEVETSEVKIGESIRVGDLEYPGVKFLAPDSTVIMGVRMARGAAEDEEEGAEGEAGAEGAEGEAAPAAEAPKEG